MDREVVRLAIAKPKPLSEYRGRNAWTNALGVPFGMNNLQLFGEACLIVALLIETKLEGILWGLAGAGVVPGIMMICKYFYWSTPRNKERYEECLENERIEQHDELKMSFSIS